MESDLLKKFACLGFRRGGRAALHRSTDPPPMGQRMAF